MDDNLPGEKIIRMNSKDIELNFTLRQDND